MDVSRIDDEFPAPSYRGVQEQAIADIRAAFESDASAVLIQAPTGSGKSLLARAIAGCARYGRNYDEETPIKAYYTTPQVSQIDDVASDPLLDDIEIIKGKGNYGCILDGHEGTPVPFAPCQNRSFTCNVKHQCPYFKQRDIATEARITGMTLAYFLQTATTDLFDKREIIVVDEAHGTPAWAEKYAAIEVGPQALPDWDEIKPAVEISSVDKAFRWCQETLPTLNNWLNTLRQAEDLSDGESRALNALEQRVPDLNWFIRTHQDPEQGTEWVIENDSDENGFIIKPLYPQRFLKHALWDRGEKFALLSATLLNKEAFCASVGLPASETVFVDLEHTFPLKHRPLYDVTQGKMTYEHRDDVIPKIGNVIARIAATHPQEKGLIHCHSYAIQSRLEKIVSQYIPDRRLRTHDRQNRDEQLEAWRHATRPEVFFSVKMEEALNLEGDLCRWQVLTKAPYPNTKDPRVAHRLDEEDDWGWYYRTTLRTLIQACGRVVRSPEDWGRTYIADDSVLDVFQNARHDMPDWFREQVDAMQQPQLAALPTNP